MNLLAIVLFHSGMVAMIMPRTLENENARYNQEGFGGKLVYCNVFRPPRRGTLLSVLIGSGVQVLSMTLITLVFECLGLLSPVNRGSLKTCGLVLCICLCTPPGYVSTRIYKSGRTRTWSMVLPLSPRLPPVRGIVSRITLLLNYVPWAYGLPAALPFRTILSLIGFWFGVSVPPTFVGTYFAFKKHVLEHPCILWPVKLSSTFPYMRLLLEAIVDKHMRVTITGPSEHSGVARPNVHREHRPEDSRESLADSRTRSRVAQLWSRVAQGLSTLTAGKDPSQRSQLGAVPIGAIPRHRGQPCFGARGKPEP
ncbi:transmembrane 9 superfamily member 2-like [Pollicipes pollicipes]|uniref:transmembrane 9 superfamily member 2-like n=1 Tax=Pollicipes pollicipes TaxID=41117 RepID=UPI0018851996|nr:transmembrane 9 superfamily member 2-like [Pollicipes pollicipes]